MSVLKRMGMLMLVALCTLSFSQIAGAADPSGKKKHATIEERFAKLDANSNGKLTLDEFTAGKEGPKLEMAKKLFTKWDTNKHGFLNLDEYKAGVEATLAAHKKNKPA
jgi:Ca2+-binding EF-hand superfamily protein